MRQEPFTLRVYKKIGKVVGAITFLILGWFLGMATRGLMAEDTEVRLTIATTALEQAHRKTSAANAETAAANAAREAKEQELVACHADSVLALKEAKEAHAVALAAREEVLQARITNLNKALATAVAKAAKAAAAPKKREPAPYPAPYPYPYPVESSPQ
jgi:flagellar biosynthesis component FlhA